MTAIDFAENLHWKFPREKRMKALRHRPDSEIEQIRGLVRNSKSSN